MPLAARSGKRRQTASESETTSPRRRLPALEHGAPRSRWGIERAARGEDARVVRTLLDAPFYARSLVTSRRDGAPVLAMHESLDLERVQAPWVRMLLPFRMPRHAR